MSVDNASRIFIVDDHPLVRDALVQLLVGAGFEVSGGAVDGREALAHPALDLPSGAGEAEPVHPGLIFRVTGRTEGNFAARLEGRVQSWLMEEGRALDVYF